MHMHPKQAPHAIAISPSKNPGQAKTDQHNDGVWMDDWKQYFDEVFIGEGNGVGGTMEVKIESVLKYVDFRNQNQEIFVQLL